MSGEVMEFPKTVEEFMEKYKIIDSEQVYTNGAKLVPIFRMKQWFEHIGAEPIRHGHWNIIEGMPTQCSLCGYYVRQKTYKYCPRCGARMDEE